MTPMALQHIRIHEVVRIISSYVVNCCIRFNHLRLVYNQFTIILSFVDTLRVNSVLLRPVIWNLWTLIYHSYGQQHPASCTLQRRVLFIQNPSCLSISKRNSLAILAVTSQSFLSNFRSYTAAYKPVPFRSDLISVPHVHLSLHNAGWCAWQCCQWQRAIAQPLMGPFLETSTSFLASLKIQTINWTSAEPKALLLDCVGHDFSMMIHVTITFDLYSQYMTVPPVSKTGIYWSTPSSTASSTAKANNERRYGYWTVHMVPVYPYMYCYSLKPYFVMDSYIG
jgi:hypothetical protein